MITMRMIVPDAMAMAVIRTMVVIMVMVRVVTVMLVVLVNMMSGHVTPHPVRQEC